MSERGMAIDEREAGLSAVELPGDERATAFASLADRHLSRAYRLAVVVLGSELEAQDAVQDAAVAAWDRFVDLRDHSRFDAWFDRILVNGCRDRLRRRGRVRLVDLGGMPEPSWPTGAAPWLSVMPCAGRLVGSPPSSVSPWCFATTVICHLRRSRRGPASLSAP